MKFRRFPIPVAPGQLSLDDVLRAYPEALRIVPTRTGWVVVLLAGGAPAPRPAVARRAAA